MTIKTPITFDFGESKVVFSLNIDPGYSCDRNTLQAIQDDGMCEPEVAHLMKRVLREGDRAIDVGANIGVFSLLMSSLVGKSGSVFAFEPTAATFQKLRENLKLNRANNVFPVCQALWDKPETLKLHMEMDSGRNSLRRTPNTISSTKVQAIPLGSAFSFPACRLIKMDAEGAEERIMLGAPHLATPQNTPYIASELNDEMLNLFDTSEGRLRRWMQSRGYDCFLLRPDGSLPTLIPVGTKISTIRANLNVLFSTVEYVSWAWPEITV